MKKPSSIFVPWLACSLLLAGSALASSDKDCDRPRAPAIPEGQTASAVDMIGATQRTKLYMESVQTFLDCLERARETVSETSRDVKIKRIDKKRDSLVTERDETIAKFNEQVRIYKIRTGEIEASTPAPDEPAAPPAPAPGSTPR